MVLRKRNQHTRGVFTAVPNNIEHKKQIYRNLIIVRHAKLN